MNQLESGSALRSGTPVEQTGQMGNAQQNGLTPPASQSDGEPVSPSVPPPQANSVQFKAGGLATALAGTRGSDSGLRPGVLVAAHRIGYSGTGMLGNTMRGLSGIGQLLDPQSGKDPLSTALQIAKAVGNTLGYGIDFSRVDNKRATVRNYLSSPFHQDSYSFDHVPDPRQQVQLRAIRRPEQSAGPMIGQADQTALPAADKRDGESHPARRSVVPSSVKGNGHWFGIDMVALSSSVNNVTRDHQAASIATVTSDTISTAADSIATFNLKGGKPLTIAAKALSLISTTVSLAPSIGQLASDVAELIRHPDSAQAKWNVANSGVQLGGGLLAAAASFVYPPAALATLLFPNFAEVGHAIELDDAERDLRSRGLTREADAVHAKHTTAALDATPVVNWFSSFYSKSLRPDIERFELAQGNRPGKPPMGELPPSAHADRAVADYYGAALRERVHTLEAAAKDYLKQIADTAQLDSVTLISRSPQMFGWPSDGQPMRVFDRAVVLTYARQSGEVHGAFIGKERDGTFRLPVMNEGMAPATGKKNLVIQSNMLDNEKQPVRFDLAACKADSTGSFYVYDPNGYAA
ncbi:hypothetical protein KZJ38_34055 [Paraburkholderia edwinii]|uniref:Uncharacterized protein n=1 Tax=Paraburkholderia edwinii TaxID=2861782 RepID=A0ABX8UXA6_9BURK|nr:hypothetical protein [Paraburkholderia edwinii]QYD71982.1 hypothetical protein KZJ38_34055 [Paraburkholderia edwinii]